MINPIGGCSTHPIIHVAVADVDAPFGAYALLIIQIMVITMLINYANYYDSKQGIVRNHCEKPCLAYPV